MKLRILLVLLALVVPTVSNALGLGKLELQSALNQPFKGRVKLLSATADELDSLRISLADHEAFDRAGIQRNILLTHLRFAIQESENGPDYIQIRSNDAIREPFLNFLLEINWSKGRLFREYTVLLDPPTYNASGSKKQTIVHPRTPVVEIDSVDNEVSYNPEYTAESKPRVSAPVRSTPSYEAPTTINYSGSGDYGPAVTGDTLWSVAKAARPDSSISIQQMMLAILSANPEAFIENNINGLKRGAILQIPAVSEVSSIAQVEALAQVSNQHGLWDEYKGHMASSVPVRAEGAGVSSSETESVDIERESSVTKFEETDEAKLRLISESDQGTGSDQSSAESSGIDINSLNNELVLANESIEALSMENAELKDKLTETEGIIDDLKRLIVLKEDELAAMQEQIMVAAAEQDSTDEIATDTEEAMEEVTDESADETMEEDAVEEEFIEESEEDETDVSDSDEVIFEDVDIASSDGALSGVMNLVNQAKDSVMGLVEKAKDYLTYIAGAVGALLLLGLGMLFASRRRSAKATVIELPAEDFPDFGDPDTEKTALMSDDIAEDDSESETVIPGSEDETILPEDDGESDADAFDIPEIPEEQSPAVVEPEAPEGDDPMEEVNVFLAYEHFDEAESFVRGALEKEPDNLDFHGKLLEVFYAASNKKSYEDAARIVNEKTGGQGTHWDMATVMWQEMSPNRALFDTPEAGEDEEASVDTPSEGVLNIAAGDDGSSDTNDMDFDIGGDESGEDMLDVTAAADMDTISAQADGDNDLDISLDSEEATASGDALDISFDEPSSEDEVLDVSVAAESDDANELDISLDSEEAIDSADALDISFDEPSSEDELLDVSVSAESDDANELDISLDSEEATASRDALDISFDAPSSEDDILDISMAAESDDANDLDFSFGDASDGDEALLDQSLESKSTDAEEGDKDLLDVTSAFNYESEGAEDLLDVTSAATAEDVEDLDSIELIEPEAKVDVDEDMDLDLSMGTELPDISLNDDLNISVEKEADDLMMDDPKDEDSDGLDFDLGILDLDISDHNVESDADSDGIDMDMESTVHMPAASIDGLIIAEDDDDDDDDKTFLVSKSTDADEQSVDEEMSSQLDLAKAYIELGDTDNAKTILDEVIAQGSDDYRKQAEELIGQID
jgi:pilus assembly protein FimV